VIESGVRLAAASVTHSATSAGSAGRKGDIFTRAP
jgi:hypothetical protein